MRPLLCAVLCVLVLLVSGGVLAQGADKKAAAEALFDEARELMDRQRYTEACKKLEASDRLDTAPGTLLNLATCYEKLERAASAWATYRRAAALARARQQPKREAFARQRAEALKAQVSKLSVRVPEASRVPGLSVTRDGVPVERPTWGQPLPTDAGSHSIVVSAPGRQRWVKQVELPAGGAIEEVIVPPLATASTGRTPDDTPPHEPSQDESSGDGQRTLGLVVGGAGVVGLAVGGVFALSAVGKNDESKAFCDANDRCTQEGVSLRDDAQSAGNVATVASGIGLAALIGGAVLYFTAPDAEETARVSAAFSIAPDHAATRVRIAW